VDAYLSDNDIKLSDLAESCSRQTRPTDCPSATAIEQNIPIYEGHIVRETLDDQAHTSQLQSEWCLVLRDGPGILAIRNAFEDSTVIDRSTTRFHEIVADERKAGLGGGDHFGSNERIWNSLQKVCLRDPDLFIDYYGNPILAMACLAWLGPAYQVTAQMNTVKPGSPAQKVHRDYHLGFQKPGTIAQYPAHAQSMSQYLTLQGAIAHTDMPPESGPTLLLPYSHHFPAGYLATSQPEFRDYFDKNASQLPLSKGDTIFFSPAVFHGAGHNRSSSDRVANLLQISSAFGRTMETRDTTAMSKAIYPTLRHRVENGSLGDTELEAVLAASTDGYAFPTNLDADPPIEGNAPENAQMLLRRAFLEGWTAEKFQEVIEAYEVNRKC